MFPFAIKEIEQVVVLFKKKFLQIKYLINFVVHNSTVLAKVTYRHLWFEKNF